MSIYEQYSIAKNKIKELTEEIKQLEPQILEEIEGLSAPMKTEQGTFGKVVKTKWTYSKATAIRETRMKNELAVVKQKEVDGGIAKKTESTGLRFISRG